MFGFGKKKPRYEGALAWKNHALALGRNSADLADTLIAASEAGMLSRADSARYHTICRLQVEALSALTMRHKAACGEATEGPAVDAVRASGARMGATIPSAEDVFVESLGERIMESARRTTVASSEDES